MPQAKVPCCASSGLKGLKQSVKTYTVYYFLENGEKSQISLEIPTNSTVLEAISMILTSFRKGSAGSFKRDPTNYTLHFTKKSGQAKDDLPALDLGIILGEVGIHVFCLKDKENEDSSLSEDSEARNSIASAILNYKSPLKREIINEKRDLKLESKGFWAFFLCRC